MFACCVFRTTLGFVFVGFYGISTIVVYLMLNPFYTYILNIYDFVWLGFMEYPSRRLLKVFKAFSPYI